MEEVMTEFCGKVVLVTGAAGSIGSELCRQLAQMNIKKLIMFDSADHLCIMSVWNLRRIIPVLILFLSLEMSA